MFITIAETNDFSARSSSTIVSDITPVVTKVSLFPTPSLQSVDLSDKVESDDSAKVGQAAIIVLGVICGLLLLALLLMMMIILAQLLNGNSFKAISNLDNVCSLRRQRKRSASSRVSSGNGDYQPRLAPAWGPDPAGNQLDSMMYGQAPIPTVLEGDELLSSRISNAGKGHFESLESIGRWAGRESRHQQGHEKWKLDDNIPSSVTDASTQHTRGHVTSQSLSSSTSHARGKDRI